MIIYSYYSYYYFLKINLFERQSWEGGDREDEILHPLVHSANGPNGPRLVQAKAGAWNPSRPPM